MRQKDNDLAICSDLMSIDIHEGSDFVFPHTAIERRSFINQSIEAFLFRSLVGGLCEAFVPSTVESVRQYVAL